MSPTKQELPRLGAGGSSGATSENLPRRVAYLEAAGQSDGASRAGSDSPLVVAALELAARGWHVLPVKGKAPAVCGGHGHLDAATEPDAVRSLWRRARSPDGVAVSLEASRLVAVDVDATGREGASIRRGLDLPPTVMARTPSGGRHFLYRWPDGAKPRRVIRQEGKPVDLLSRGFVVVPPGEGRHWIDGAGPDDVPLAAAPAWLTAPLKARPNGRRPAGADPEEVGTLTAYIRAALDGEFVALATSREGERNDALNRAAFNFGTLVGAGHLPESEALDALRRGAVACGIWEDDGEGACLATIRSGLEAGVSEPRTKLDEPKRRARKTGHGDEDDGENSKLSQASQLVALAIRAGAEFWHTSTDVPFATVPVDGHKVTFPLRSRAFSAWLRLLFYRASKAAAQAEGNEADGKAIGAAAVTDAIGTLEGQARFDGPEHEAHVRMAGYEGRVYIDLGSPDWRAVEIDRDGWRLVSDLPVKFHRPAGVLSLPEPVAGADIGDLWRFVHVTPEDRPLILGWLVMACCPSGPYPVLNLLGEHGSGKSTASRVLRALVDPNTAPLRAAPHDGRDLMIAASNARVVVFENLSGLQPWLSDALCRLATGGGSATRTLYTDDEETLFEAQRPVILNGISDLATRADLLDRSILVTLPCLPDSERRPEREFDAEFEAARPELFGCLLDAVVCALRRREEVRFDRLPRMADAAIWIEAAAPALGLELGDFLAAYTGNRASANEVALDGADWWPVLQAELDSRNGEWLAAAGEILDALNSRRGEGRAPKGWPATAHGMSGQLRRLAPNMRAAGVGVEFGLPLHSKSSRGIRLSREAGMKVPAQTSVTSAKSADRGPGADDVATLPTIPNREMARTSALLTEVGDDADDADVAAGTLSFGHRLAKAGASTGSRGN